MNQLAVGKKMDTQSFTPDLMWVDQSESGSQSHVRAHIVRERRRRASWEEKKIMERLQRRSQNGRNISPNAPSETINKQNNLTAGYSELLGGGRRDPFATYPVESTISTLELLDYFLFSLKVHRQPFINVRTILLHSSNWPIRLSSTI